ncbi:MAG: CheR family methyltransferase [Chloroflexia bacterium]
MWELDEAAFTELRERIQACSGIYLDDSRRRSFSRTVAGRLSHHGLRTWEDYRALLDSPAGKEEMSALLEEVVNRETSFFRNPRHFRLLAEVVLPELERLRPAGLPLRLWSAGCSTGQEAYSLAITVAETLGCPPRRPVEILATDLSRQALEYARQGRFTERQVQRVEPAYLSRYFERQGEWYSVKPELRELVRFHEVNLVAEPLPPFVHGVDVIFCRNVTIYFRIETSRRLMANLYRCLKEGGYLFIGFSETLWQVFDAFERVQRGGVFFYRKGKAARPTRPEVPLPRPRSVPGGSSVERPLFLGTAPTHPQPIRRTGDERRQAAADEEPARAHYQHGLSCLRDGMYEEAVEAFRAALREEPNLVEAFCGLAQVYANQGRYTEALRACERALELDDLAEEAYLLRGLIHRQQGRLEQAVADLERAAYLNPSSPTAHYYLGDLFLALSDRRRAAQAFRRTWRTLLGRPEEDLIDGVPVHLLRQACRKHLEVLEGPAPALPERPWG